MPRSHTDDTVRQKGQEEGAGSTPKHLAPPRGLPGEGRGTHGRNVPERAMTAGPWAGCRYINSCWVPGRQCPCLRDPCGLQDGCTASIGRAGLRVPAEPLNSLKYNQPLSRPPAAGGGLKSYPLPQLGTRPGPRRRQWAVGALTGCWEGKRGGGRGRQGQGPPRPAATAAAATTTATAAAAPSLQGAAAPSRR